MDHGAYRNAKKCCDSIYYNYVITNTNNATSTFSASIRLKKCIKTHWGACLADHVVSREYPGSLQVRCLYMYVHDERSELRPNLNSKTVDLLVLFF